MEFSFLFEPDRNTLMTGAHDLTANVSLMRKHTADILRRTDICYLLNMDHSPSISHERISPLKDVFHILNVDMKSTFYHM